MPNACFETERLLLRQWRASDREPFGALNRDPEVMAHMPRILPRSTSDRLADKMHALLAANGWGFWALELKRDGLFIGFCGLHEPEFELPFSPCVEIAWRLARPYWGRGYATEAASRCLDFGFAELQLREVVALTARTNARSQALMRRLGMVASREDFLHPKLPTSSPLCQHRLYRITALQWWRQKRPAE